MNKVIKVLQKIEENFLITCLSVMGIILTIQILLRYFFNAPISWAEELARYLQIWITFIGIGYGFRKSSHIALTLIKDKLPLKIAIIVSIINNIIMIFSCGVVIYISPIFLTQQNKLSSAMHVSMQLVYCVIPIGFVIAIIYLVADILRELKFWDHPEEAA